MLWNCPRNQDVDYYFYNTTLIKGFNAMNNVFIHMPKAENSLSIIENKQFNSAEDEPEPKRSKKNPILFDQTELLGSRLKEKNLFNEN